MKKYSVFNNCIVIDFPGREQQAAIMKYRWFNLLLISTMTILFINKIIVL